MFRITTRTIALALLCTLPAASQGFIRAFKEAVDLGDTKVALNLVTKHRDDAIDYARTLSEELALGRENQMRDYFLQLADAFKKAHKSDLIRKMGSFYRNRGAEVIPKIRQLIRNYQMKFNLYTKGSQGHEESWQKGVAYFNKLGDEARQIGEMLCAANCYYLVYLLEREKKKDPDLEKVYAASEKFVKCRQAWDYRQDRAWGDVHRTYENFKRQKDAGRALSYGGGGEGETKGVKVKYVEGSNWEKVTGRFKPWTDPEVGLTPATGSRPLMWRMCFISGLVGAGADKGFRQLFGHEPVLHLVRTKVSRYGVDVNGDHRPDARVKLVGKPAFVEFPLVYKTGKEKGALFFWAGGSQEDLSGITMNVAPNMNFVRVFYRGATGREYEFQGQKLWFIDENATGKFGDAPTQRVVRHGACKVSLLDSMILPGERKLRPFCQFIRLKGGLYHAKFSGLDLMLRELDVKGSALGRMKLKFTGPRACKPSSLIVGGDDSLPGFFFDLAAEPGGVEVPAGRYRIVNGRVEAGRGRRAVAATIVSGKAATINVQEGEAAVVEVGAPYVFDFKHRVGNKLTIDGTSVQIRGRGGEVYLDIWGGVPEPTVLFRRKGRGRGRAIGQLARPEDGKALDRFFNAKNQQNRDFRLMDAVFSIMDLRVDIPPTEMEVKLIESRHPLFGKVESEWK